MAFKVVDLNRHRNCASSCKDSVLIIFVITLELTQHIAYANNTATLQINGPTDEFQ